MGMVTMTSLAFAGVGSVASSVVAGVGSAVIPEKMYQQIADFSGKAHEEVMALFTKGYDAVTPDHVVVPAFIGTNSQQERSPQR